MLQRYQELLDLVVIQYVSASQLNAYAQAASSPQAPFRVLPAADKPYYCFVPTEVLRSDATQIPADYNVCTGALGPAILAARDFGKSAVVPLNEGKSKTLAFEVPIYRGGSAPSTAAARRS